jgi:hypothetical protein
MRLLLLLLLATPLFAQREICRFRAGDAVDPFRRWLSSQEVTCSAAELPSGQWNVFVRGGAEVSLPMLVNGGTPIDASTFTMTPAATLTVQLPDAHTGVVYLPRRAVAFPVSGTRVEVPVGEELWLLVLEKSRAIASLIQIPAIEAGTERTIDARTGGLTSALLGWLRVADTDRKALQDATGILSPQVRLTAAGPSRDSDPLPPLAALNGAFVLVRGVSAGDAELDIGGKGWLPHRTRVTIGARSITSVPEPLLVRPAASLIVSFSTDSNLLELDASLGSCDPSQDRPARYEISVSACAKPKKKDDPIDPKSCRLIRQESFAPEVPYGSFAVDDVAPGLYRAEMHFGKLPPVSTMVTVAALQQQPMRLRAPYATLYGSLTRGGEPIRRDATIAFPGGGVGFASEDGEYRAVVLATVEIGTDARIDVAACKGEPRAWVLANELVRPFSRFNIDIPDNSITVSVTDTFTQMTLHNATLRYVVMSKLFPFRPVFTRTFAANDMVDGRFVIEAVPERQIHLTVSHGGYEKYVIKPFTMSKSEHETIDVQMMPLRGIRGRIISPVPFDEGTVTWHRPDGRVDETVDVAPDGSFAHERSHEPGQIMTVVSRSHPLWILRMPQVAPRQTLDLRFPDAPARTFDVKVEGVEASAEHTIGVSVGGLVVPLGALSQHQRLRDGHLRIRGNRSETVHDILETGPIEVFTGAPEWPRTRLMPGVTELVLTPSSQ